MDVRLSLLQVLLLACVLVEGARQTAKYKYFDEYLVHLEKKEQYILIEEISVHGASTSLYRTGVSRSKDENCCVLGQLAGDKGYHCSARFYASRVLRRNYNRVHNKRIPALLKGRPDPAADKLMRTFGRCVAGRGALFHKCCRHAALEAS